MGWFCSSPNAARRYRGPPGVNDNSQDIRYFGRVFRSGSVSTPDDIYALPSCQDNGQLVSDPYPILYEAEIDQGLALRGIRPLLWMLAFLTLPFAALKAVVKKVDSNFGCTCDESCQWVRKEYSTRVYFRVYSNRIATNSPSCRVFGMLGCGSWNGDSIKTHSFDRGAFGFRRVNAGVLSYVCCLWPIYGSAVARQRCPCNGPIWHGGWWCEEWPCDMLFCTYRYTGIADGDEAAFASSIALQAYFEQRTLTREDMDKCLDYWRNNISQQTSGRTRDACCEPYSIRCCTCERVYESWTHRKRNIPYGDDDPRNTEDLRQVYDQYNDLCKKQIQTYKEYTAPVHKSTCCKAFGCRRVFGRKGCIFCTEGCDDFSYFYKKKPHDPPPPFTNRDVDDENDASVILRHVLGDPPANVVYKRWVFDAETNENVLVTWTSDNADVEKGLVVRSEAGKTIVDVANEGDAGGDAFSVTDELVSSSKLHTA